MFDEEPDGDPHGECALEIRRLTDINGVLLKALRALLTVDPDDDDIMEREQARAAITKAEES